MGKAIKKTFGGIFKFGRKFDVVGNVLGLNKRGGGGGDDNQIPGPFMDPEAYLARDRLRRLAKKAQGQESTIRTSVASPYNPTPKQLLGS